MAAPTDPNFYLAVIPMAQRLGTKPEDLLWVWASETGFDPTLSGGSRTISTLMHGVVPELLTEAEWTSLPTLSPQQQLPYIERFYKLLHDRYLGGRGFQDTFEAYLANAAPSLLRRDGRYNQATTMYGDPNAPASGMWLTNWPMDNFPIARQQASARSAKLDLPFGQQLVSEGLLKGWITLNDLKSFMVRGDVVTIANDAVNRLHAAQAGTAVALEGTAQSGGITPAAYVNAGEPGGFAPDFSKSFGDPAAPIDVRVAPSAPQKRPLLGLAEMAFIGVGAWFLLKWLRK